jgi:hypothetical protein
VALFPEQFIEHIQGRWGGDQDYKFGVMYRTKEGGNEFRASTSRRSSIAKESTISKLSKKVISISFFLIKFTIFSGYLCNNKEKLTRQEKDHCHERKF